MNARRLVHALAATASAAGLAFTGPVLASGATASTATTAYAAECGGCHVAYPARLLSTAEWSQVLVDLEHHFGVDASLDAATLQAVSRQLGVTPPLPLRNGDALPRITSKPWFRQEHDELPPATFKSQAVGSAANCTACHADADRGKFDEDSVRIPR